SKQQKPARFLFGLGIDLIGRSTAEELVEQAGSLERLFALSQEELLELPHVGPETARSLYESVRTPEFQAELKRFKKLGLGDIIAQAKVEDAAAMASKQLLAGLTFVITGSLA